MPSWQSIRFRLSVQYSAVVFGLGGVLLGLVYLALRSWLQSQTMMGYIIKQTWVEMGNGVLVRMPEMTEVELQAVQTVIANETLDKAARFTLVALGALFLLSLVVGWVMSGRVLKPVEEITTVAREIQASDLSRRIALEGPDDELTRLANTFDAMLERLDRAFMSQRRFLADTSHDLRTPLAVIRSNVELVADDPEADIEEWENAGVVIRRNAEKMSVMIDDLLAAARLQAGKSQAVTLDLAEMVETRAAEFGPVASESGISIVTSVSPTVVQGVEVSLERAMTNLLDNAARHAPPDSTITLGAGTLGEWAWLAVDDEGPGLSEDDEHVGLGLSIVTQIAEGHGGSLATFPGRSGKGTTMVVWVPTEKAEEPAPASSPFTQL